jgi:hypothetical protein
LISELSTAPGSCGQKVSADAAIPVRAIVERVVSLLWAKKQNDLSALSQRAAHYSPIASAITCIFAAIAVMILSDD